jgi:hypothetical protein
MSDQYIVYGPNQLAKLVGPERKYGTNGYRVVPCNNGMTGDGWGYTEWTARIVLAEVETWLPCIGFAASGMQYRWHYTPENNTWCKECRNTRKAETPPSEAVR